MLVAEKKWLEIKHHLQNPSPFLTFGCLHGKVGTSVFFSIPENNLIILKESVIKIPIKSFVKVGWEGARGTMEERCLAIY